MAAYAGDGDKTDRGEALLWAAPTGPPPAPPIDTRPQVLPIGELGWANAEKLFLRLLRRGSAGSVRQALRRSRSGPGGDRCLRPAAAGGGRR